MPQPQSCATFPALGSEAVVCTSAADQLEDACLAVREVVDEFDRACSRFRDDSELSALNAADGEPVPVSPLLLEAVETALRAARLTGGDVDPTVGAALIALGYDRDFAQLAERPRARAPLAAVPGWRTVRLDRAASTIRLPAGVRLDLGATAKALAADHAAERAQVAVGCGVLVGLGGDFAIAGAPPAPGWRIRITDDHRAGTAAPGQWIKLRSGGLATSSVTTRRWQTGSGGAHHLLDPSTGMPTTGTWRTVSVAAGSCVDANIASTAAIVRSESAAAWLAEQSLPSRLVAVDGSVVHLAGWPAEGDELSPPASAMGSAA